MTKRNWYAHYCRYGCNAVHANNTSIYWGDYYAFDSKKSRDGGVRWW